ncbi:hypothetical protein CLF_103209 [Clonorchis sinensis]|uniref:Uncharacterized protein n=1 Tax=Clonorchis sinensis TaxID=79923 RepID=G7Y9A0_CLOSI|nr:hypothetical protein CLF_103209 [Clonorchis sinensis]
MGQRNVIGYTEVEPIQERALRIQQKENEVFLEHYNRLNLLLGPERPDRCPCRRIKATIFVAAGLTTDELEEFIALLKYSAPSSKIRRYVADRCDDMSAVIAKLRKCGRSPSMESKGGSFGHLRFTQHIALFRRFAHVVNFAATHWMSRPDGSDVHCTFYATRRYHSGLYSLLISGASEIDYYITVIAAATSPAHYVQKNFGFIHQLVLYDVSRNGRTFTHDCPSALLGAENTDAHSLPGQTVPRICALIQVHITR